MSKKAVFLTYIDKGVLIMSDKNIIEKVLSESDSFQDKSTAELREMLDKELSKPDKQIDYGLVDELTTAVLEAEGKKCLAVDVDAELNKLEERTLGHNRRFRFPKWTVGLSAACVILLCANCISVSAWDMNIFSAIIELTKGGFSVDFGESETEIIELPTSENDPYGFIAKLAEYDIEFETPYYIPEGFMLTEVETNVNENVGNTVRFIYCNDKQNFSIDFTRFWNEVVPMGIPSDHYNISETEVNGSPAIVSKEDNQYTIMYQKEKTVFTLAALDVPYSECEKIVDSIE